MATTGIRFFQTLGSALGASVFGTVLARLYAADGPGGDVSALARLTGSVHAEGVRAFVSATDVVFWSGAALMTLAAVLAVRLPRPGRPENTERPVRQPEPVPA